MADTLTWLHLSDLHAYNARYGWESREVMDELIKDLRRMQREQTLRPDLIFFTGDAAFGNIGDRPGDNIMDQFTEAESFFEEVRNAFQPPVDKMNMFLVPGNHDIDRTLITKDQTYWLQECNSLNEIIELIRSQNLHWHRLMERFVSYRQFLETCGYDHLLTDPESLTFAVKRDLPSVSVGIVGLNSAWSCSGEADRGQLCVGGKWQVGKLLNDLASSEPINLFICLIHHPDRWFKNFEVEGKGNLTRKLEKEFHFLLHGHEHDDWVTTLNTDLHTRIAAAACYDRSDGQNGYNFVRLHITSDTQEGEVWLREWNPDGGRWVPRHAGDNTTDSGCWSFNFRPLKTPFNLLESEEATEVTSNILLAHAPGQETLAHELARPLRRAGYKVAYQGSVVVGHTVAEEASDLLKDRAPVVLCVTVKALGTGWAIRLLEEASQYEGVRTFGIQIEEDAYLKMLPLDGSSLAYWQDPQNAVQDLVASLEQYGYLPARSTVDIEHALSDEDAEQRYRELALKWHDIINLANLPEDDRHVATRQLELRQLYVALRVRVEISSRTEAAEGDFAAIERRRSTIRRGIGSRLGWGDEPNRVPVGHRLAESPQLIILGDPGAGKTTMLRWIATAYLLRLKQDPDWRDVPDVETLPAKEWLPILVRCRYLDSSTLSSSLENMLNHALRKMEVTEADIDVLQPILMHKIEQGQALLLFDGLDEIADPSIRIRFSQQLENIHLRYPDTPIIATSRIVGYREMGYHTGQGFEHVTVTDLSREDKDYFARRWCAATEPIERQETATQELIQDIHSSDRIERLTGNPMLLTTMALVKRKVGKLPSRRTDLYWDALGVLLNWRREVDAPIDHREAVPQLEYLAYAMCDRGVQQLRQSEVIALLEDIRREFPQVRPIQNHAAQDFLHLLERRTGILVEAGHIRHVGMTEPVLEYRHLTFQEYLAARALVDGRFPNRDRTRSLAENVAPLAGRVAEVESSTDGGRGVAAENWREVLRLCVTSCNDDDVDSVLLAILNPLPGEDSNFTVRPRALLAALCLTDEPNASQEVARQVLREFVRQVRPEDDLNVDSDGGADSTKMDIASIAYDLATTYWGKTMSSFSIDEMYERDFEDWFNFWVLGVQVWWHIDGHLQLRDGIAVRTWIAGQVPQIMGGDEKAAIEAMLRISAVYAGISDLDAEEQPEDILPPELIDSLFSLVTRGSAAASGAAALALAVISSNELTDRPRWHPSSSQVQEVVSIVTDPMTDLKPLVGLILLIRQSGDEQAVEPLVDMLEREDRRLTASRMVAVALGEIGDPRAVRSLIRLVEDVSEDDQLRSLAITSLGEIGDPRAIGPLIRLVEDDGARVLHLEAPAKAALATLVGKDETDRKLLSKVLDGVQPYLDYHEEVSEEFVAMAATRLAMPDEEVRRRFERMAQQLPLKLSWSSHTRDY